MRHGASTVLSGGLLETSGGNPTTTTTTTSTHFSAVSAREDATARGALEPKLLRQGSAGVGGVGNHYFTPVGRRGLGRSLSRGGKMGKKARVLSFRYGSLYSAPDQYLVRKNEQKVE